MSVRRLAAVQPASFAFSDENLAWARKTIEKYPPGKQASAVLPLLWRAQEQNQGWISRAAMDYVGDMLGMAPIRVLEVATFYTMFQLSPVGTAAHIQVCGTTPCMLRGAQDLRAVCERKIHPEPHHVTPDGKLSWEEVECLGACVNAPMVQVWKDTYEDLTPEALEKMIDGFAAGRPPQPGSQAGRQFSAPADGPTTLTDLDLYKGQRTFVRQEPPPPPPPAPVAATPAAPTDAARPPILPIAVAANPQALVSAPAIRPNAALVMPPVATPAKPGVAAKAKPAPVASVEKPAIKPKPDGKPENLTLLDRPRKEGADDLKLIWGVGPKLESMLNAMGIWHFDQIATWKKGDVVWVDERLEGFKGRATRDKWVTQSKQLAKGWRPAKGSGDKPE